MAGAARFGLAVLEPACISQMIGSDNEMNQFDQTIETPLDLLMIVDQFS